MDDTIIVNLLHKHKLALCKMCNCVWLSENKGISCIEGRGGASSAFCSKWRNIDDFRLMVFLRKINHGKI